MTVVSGCEAGAKNDRKPGETGGAKQTRPRALTKAPYGLFDASVHRFLLARPGAAPLTPLSGAAGALLGRWKGLKI